jgi:Ni/Fe-hydrogenase subunit HybB-like protein
MTAVWGVLAALGTLAFLLGVNSADAPRVWCVYLANLVFWAGLAVTGPAIAGMMQLTEARWSPSVRRIALTTAGFLPVAFVLLVLLILGQGALYGSWLHPSTETQALVAKKAAWLNAPFFWTRTLVFAAALFLVALAFVRLLLRDPVHPGDDAERSRRNRLAVVLLFLWVITVSLWGFDLVMTLDPIWYSGLFGGYFVVSTLYTGFALLSILTVRANARGLATVPPGAVQDVAKLQFAMSIMWMYFFWSQYLVIWYGNVPIETRFVVRRFFVQPWQTLAWIVMIVGWLIPFLYLLKRLTGRPPQRHTPLVVIAAFGLVAIFLERLLVIVPSVLPGAGLPLGWRELFITGGFLGLFVLSRRWFFARFRPVLNLPHTGH